MTATLNILYWRRYLSPCGSMLLAATATELMLADWITGDCAAPSPSHESVTRNLRYLLRAFPADMVADNSSPLLAQATAQLDEYFNGIRRSFSVPLKFAGTSFQRRVWEELLAIPYGSTLSYGEVAARIGMPGAARGVAAAIGANRMSVFVPCHRVIGVDGSMTGYAGGLQAKRFMLYLESRNKQRGI